MTEKPSRGAPPLRLAEFLRQEHDGILAEWEKVERETLESAKRAEERRELYDQIPPLLQAIAATADQAQGGEVRVSLLRKDARLHALHRLEKRFSLEEVTREYALLRKVILGRLVPRVGELDFGELVLLNDFLDQAIIEAVVTYNEGATGRLGAEKQRLSTVVEHLPAAVLMAEAPSGRLTYGNRQVQKLLRHPFLPAENISEYARYKAFHANGRPVAPEEFPLARSIQHSEVVDRELFEFERGDGTRGIFALSSAPLRDKEGNVTSGIVTFWDVTESKAAEQAAKESERRFRLLLDSSTEGIWGMDSQGVFTFANPACARLLGYDSPEELVGRWVHPLIHHSRADGTALPEAECHIQRAFRQEEEIEVDDEVLWRKDGTCFPMHYRASPLHREGKVVGAVVVFSDVSDRKRLEALERERASFEKQLIGIVSHDLRTPLSAILLGVKAVLRHEEVDARLTQGLVRIQSSAERALRMIRDLLDFTQARLGEGLSVKCQSIDLHQLARQTLAEVRTAHPGRDIRLEASGEGGGQWDADRISQLLINLLTNALKYGLPDRPVTVRTRGESDAVTLEVHNLGAPIPSEARRRLFEPLHRGPSQDPEAGQSVGLGLYIVDQVVRAHGGTVEVDSTAERGTIFRVRLPRHGPSQPKGAPPAPRAGLE